MNGEAKNRRNTEAKCSRFEFEFTQYNVDHTEPAFLDIFYDYFCLDFLSRRAKHSTHTRTHNVAKPTNGTKWWREFYIFTPLRVRFSIRKIFCRSCYCLWFHSMCDGHGRFIYLFFFFFVRIPLHTSYSHHIKIGEKKKMIST